MAFYLLPNRRKEKSLADFKTNFYFPINQDILLQFYNLKLVVFCDSVVTLHQARRVFGFLDHFECLVFQLSRLTCFSTVGLFVSAQ
jgi:hypothetical protein